MLAQCEFALEEIPLIDLIESLLVQANEHGDSAFDFDAWTVQGAPEAPLRTEYRRRDSRRAGAEAAGHGDSTNS